MITMKLSELLAITDHIKTIKHKDFYVKVISNLVLGDVIAVHFWDGDGSNFFESRLSIDAICEVKFKDYDSEIAKLIEAKAKLDNWLKSKGYEDE